MLFSVILSADIYLKIKKREFENLQRLEQVVILTFLIYSSSGMFGNDMPFTTHIIDLLCERVLKEFAKVFKTYKFGPRDIQRLRNCVLSSALQRAFAQLFLVENSRYKFRRNSTGGYKGLHQKRIKTKTI